ncbi:MAG: hypothetical protein GX856_06015, partial [Gammaproteobacteria bacterium]|nr:hypothetical protein [Gammaproteobacteria bacterium]
QLVIPPAELWENIPGVTDHVLERSRTAAAEGDAFANRTALLERQAAPAPEPEPEPEPATVG